MSRSKLTGHDFKKGLFKTPFNSIDNLRLGKWNYNRLPGYFWIGLIVKKFGHEKGLEKCFKVIKYIIDLDCGIDFPLLSSLFKLSTTNQNKIYNFILDEVGSESLYPLTLLYPYSKQATFNELFNHNGNEINRIEKLVELIEETYDHQSEISTDIRFIIVWSAVLTGKLKFMKDMQIVEALNKYPYCSHKDEIMRQYRPTIRSTEGVFFNMYEKVFSEEFNKNFWEEISVMTECKLLYVNMGDEVDQEEINSSLKFFKEAFKYYEEYLRTFDPISIKTEVILSVLTYSYKRVLELVEHNLYVEISGRTIIRSIIENYIMLKYLITEESKHEDIWTDYVRYGLGQYKLIAARYSDNANAPKNSHIPIEYIDVILDTETDQKFLDMDTKYFDKKSIREKAILVNEKELFDYYYDYDSQFEHGLWGAIRESVSIVCDNPAHKYHHSLDIENNQKHKNVWSDCNQVLRKSIDYIETIYPLPNKVKKYGV